MCNRDEKDLLLLPIPHWLGGGEAVVEADRCMVPILKGFNAAGIKTTFHCCGHGEYDGYIALEDGRAILYKKNKVRIVKSYTDKRCFPHKEVVYNRIT